MSTALIVIMHDPLVFDFLETKINAQASNAFECKFNARIYHLDILQGKLILSDVVVTSVNDKQWFWTADSIAVIFSWMQLFKKGELQLRIFCGVLQIETALVDKKIAIADHIASFTRDRPVAVPIIPLLVQIPKAHVVLHINPEITIDCTVAGAVEDIDGCTCVGLTLSKDSLSYRDHPLIKDLALHIKKITHKVTKKDITELQGTLQVRDALLGSFCPGKLQGLFTDNTKELSFVSSDAKTQAVFVDDARGKRAHIEHAYGHCDLMSDSAGQAHIVYKPMTGDSFDFALQYCLNPDHVTLDIMDDTKKSLHATLFYNGTYVVNGTTEFFHGLLQKISQAVAYDDKAFIKYSDFLNYKAPIKVHGSRTASAWLCGVDLSQLQLRIPFTYNFLRSVRSTAIFSGGDHVFLKSTFLKTDRGTIKSALSTAIIDAEHKHIQSVHVPFCVEDFFINYTKDFFAQLSGAFVFEYLKDDRSKLSGVGMIKKCHIRNNPLSTNMGNALVSATLNAFVKHPYAQATDLELVVKSHEPVDIKTEFLKARAHVALQVLGTLGEPQLYGTIELVNGTLNFPYKPLEISYGKIFFVDNQLDDPTIELSASATIKNYTITMYVQGTARNPVITFHSLPNLQEEQIISLLLGGSPDSSLSLVMPLSSMGLVEKLLVGDSQESSGLLDSFKNWLGPLDKVKIVPRFSDQTSRGGLRGALAIDVSENLSALIQQNFSLSEDTLIEVAYKPTDELTVRGMRDERGDLGGEIEARFTW